MCWNPDWIPPCPSSWTLDSPLVLAAGRAALAGLAPAARDTMLQVSLGRMEFCSSFNFSLLSQEPSCFPGISSGKAMISVPAWMYFKHSVKAGFPQPCRMCHPSTPLLFYFQENTHLFKGATSCLCVCSQGFVERRKWSAARNVVGSRKHFSHSQMEGENNSFPGFLHCKKKKRASCTLFECLQWLSGPVASGLALQAHTV